ncbi:MULTISPECIES: 30S ribosomal protein S8e [unclassified Haladaptatus]|uniref:30S ribosomal protein S8e n=1 Tax=unclassified Haladaptatus TaxID=2622732 RepID=UPI00209BD47F|nr:MULTISPECIES: 30S ribosomal protein S8e [unclassified Haladaptatus]MCO8243151.1 30S ribosomal protein S8e [Haladaptatus sp. AB643]MCO8252863.1 30S ribosomal protein S8e [Haladaptatus sp. AB618]
MKDQGRSTRKRTGGRLKPLHKKKKHELGRQPTETQVGEPRFRTTDARGRNSKIRALTTNVANVTDGGETVSATIQDVLENGANPNYARRNIITKGAVIVTNEGKARVTSRPGQTGQVNAVAIDDE